ncbi:MAG: amidohydrolase family protein [Gemmatimonadetes bacterium]|nr:amidohydrolase family protein [Gemmatimonadota bacterium]
MTIVGGTPHKPDAAEPAAVRAYRARIVAPVGAPPIRDGVVVVDEDEIAYVGPSADAPAVPTENLGDVVLTPGLVNTHTHLDLTAYQGVLDGLDFFGWIRTLTRSKATLSPAELLDSARAGILRGLARGITTFADTANTDAALDAMAELGVRGIAYREVFGPDPAVAAASLAELAGHVRAMRARATPLVQVGVSPHAPYSVSDALFEAVAAFARAEQLPMAIHIAESEAETELVVHGRGPFAAFLASRGIAVVPRAETPIALLARARALGAQTLLIHAVRVNADDIVTIARHGCGVAHCPHSNAWFMHGTAPAAAMLAGGVRLGIGTDSMGSNDGMDVLREAAASLAAQRAALASSEGASSGEPGAFDASAAERRAALDATDPLTLATRAGARALRLDDRIGVLAPGFQADLAWFPLPSALDAHATLSTASVGAALAAAGRDAVGVEVAGRRLPMQAARGSDFIALERRVAEITTRLRGWRAADTPG